MYSSITFNTRITSCIHRDQDTEQFYHLLKTPCCPFTIILSLQSLIPKRSVTVLSVIHHYGFVLLRISYKWNHLVCSLLLSLMPLRFIQVVAWFNGWFHYIVEQYSIIWMYHHLSLHQLKDSWVVSNLWRLWPESLYKELCTKFLFINMFISLWQNIWE